MTKVSIFLTVIFYIIKKDKEGTMTRSNMLNESESNVIKLLTPLIENLSDIQLLLLLYNYIIINKMKIDVMYWK